MDPRADAELVADIQKGSILAFEVLVRRYERHLQNFIYRILNNKMGAEEVAQDTFFKIYTTIERIDISRKFSAYLFEIAKNGAISLLRQKHAELSLADETAIGTDEKIYEALAREQRAENVNRAIARIDLKYQRVIKLYYFDDLSYGEISSKLRLPLNTVRTHLARAKDLLKSELKKTYENS